MIIRINLVQVVAERTLAQTSASPGLLSSSAECIRIEQEETSYIRSSITGCAVESVASAIGTGLIAKVTSFGVLAGCEHCGIGFDLVQTSAAFFDALLSFLDDEGMCGVASDTSFDVTFISIILTSGAGGITLSASPLSFLATIRSVARVTGDGTGRVANTCELAKGGSCHQVFLRLTQPASLTVISVDDGVLVGVRLTSLAGSLANQIGNKLVPLQFINKIVGVT